MGLEIRLQNNICKVRVYGFTCSSQEDLLPLLAPARASLAIRVLLRFAAACAIMECAWPGL